MNRRQFGKLAAASIATAATAGTASAQDDEDDPTGPWETTYNVAVAVKDVMVMPVNQTLSAIFGDRKDYEHYTGEGALRKAIHTGSQDLRIGFRDLISTYENDVAFLQNVLVPKGMAQIAEAIGNDENQEAAEQARDEALEEHCALLQEDILRSCQRHVNQWIHYYEQLLTHDNTDPGQVLWACRDTKEDFAAAIEAGEEPEWYHDGLENPVDWYEIEVELIDGSTTIFEAPEIPISNWTNDVSAYPDFVAQNAVNGMPSDLSPHNLLGAFPNDADGNPIHEEEGTDRVDVVSTDQIAVNVFRYDDALDALSTQFADAYGELQGTIDQAYSYYDPSDIDTEDVLDPTTAYLEFRNEIDDEAFQGAMAASMLGIPRTDEPMDVRLEDEDLEVEGSIYTTDTPGEDGFSVGETYDPDDLSGTVTLRYTFLNEDGEQETDFHQLQQPFTILEATDADGEPVENVDAEESVQYDPAQIEEMMDQLEQIRQEQNDLIEEAEEPGGWNIGLPGNPLSGIGQGVQLLGFGIIGVVVLGAVGWVTDLLPFGGD